MIIIFKKCKALKKDKWRINIGNIRIVWHMKTRYSSKCPNTLYTADITRPNCFDSFCE